MGFIEDSTWHQGHLSIVTLTVTNPSFGTFRGHALKRPWLESEVTCNAYAAGEPWEVAGAEGPLDIAEEVAGSITPLTTGEQGFALSPDVVRRWVDDPANNQGILLDDSGRWNGCAFHSGEWATESQRPRLTVEVETAPPPQDDPVLVGAGDISKCANDEATAKLLDAIPGTIFTVGDNAYDGGSAAQFENCYDPTWGRHKGRTMPAVGNHEYETPGASGYFGYFGSAAGDPSKGYFPTTWASGTSWC